MTHTPRNPFGRLFEDVSQHFEMMDRIMEGMIQEAGSDRGDSIYGPFYYGFSMTVGPDGQPAVKEFGNFRPQNMNRLANGTREPLVDAILDAKKNIVRVAAEMPGVTKDDIKVSATGKTLTISAERGDKKYHTEVKLPTEVIEGSSDASYNNGILELKLKAKGSARQSGTGIRVR